MKRLASATLASLLVACLTATASSATIITPSTTGDDTTNGNCTLREAVQAANTDAAVDQCPAGSGADVIQLGSTTYHLQLSASTEDANASGDLDVSQPLTIQGNGADATTIDGTGGNDRLVDVLTNAATTIQNLTLTNGTSQGGSLLIGGPGRPGGAVRAQSPLTLTGVTISHSSAADGNTGTMFAGANGNAGGDGGGVWTDHALTINGGRFVSDHAGNGSAGRDGANVSPGSGSAGNPGGDGGRGGDGGAVAVTGGAQLTINGTTFDTVQAGHGGLAGNGSNGDDNSSGTGHVGGDGGDGGRGGSGGAISATGPATLTGITTTATSSGSGGAGGVGGEGGSGNTSAHQGPAGTSGVGGDGGDGGALSGDAGTLTLSGAAISGSSAGTGGAGPQEVTHSVVGEPRAGSGGAGGAVAGGTVDVDHSVIADAHAGAGGLSPSEAPSPSDPGGIGGNGGGIRATSTANVTDTTITGSSAGAGGRGASAQAGDAGMGGPGGLGGAVTANTATVTNATLDHDSAGAGGNGGTGGGATSHANGGSGGTAGALFASHGSIANTTFASDAAGAGGTGGKGGSSGAGGYGGAIVAIGLDLSLSHVTISGSSFATGAPPGTGGGAIWGAATVSDSAIAGNTSPQCSGTSNGSGNVSFPDASCGGANADPKLGPLADNGGLTKTELPRAGSAALDTGSCTGTDQRGVPRPQGPACDSGAVEAANPALAANGLDFGTVSQGGTATRTTTVHTTFDPLTPQASLSSPDFSLVSDGCSAVALAPAAACSIQVKFTAPSAPLGPHLATLHLTHDAAGPASDVQLSVIVVDTAPPVLSGLTLTHKTFRVAKRKPAPKGTTIRFNLSEAASVQFTVTQKLPGRRKGKRCVAPTKKLRHAKHCTRTKTVGSFTRSASSGRASIPFNGRIGGRKLKPGSYSLTASATDPSGNQGLPKSTAFKIVRAGHIAY